MMPEMRRIMTLCEAFLHGFRPAYIRDKDIICEIYKNPSRQEYRRVLGKNYQVRAFLVGPDLLVWNVFASLHQTVREELKLGNDAIPVNLYGSLGDEAAIVVTDNTKNTPWWHNGEVADTIETNPFMMRNFTHLEIDYYDSAIVGDWTELSSQETDDLEDE